MRGAERLVERRRGHFHSVSCVASSCVVLAAGSKPSVLKMSDTATINTQSIADYLAQLLKDRKQVTAFPNVFMHVERLIDEEIAKVRSSLFQVNGMKKEPLVLPEAQGTTTTLTEKVFVPVKEHPDFNFVGRILGPRGMTAKQLEQETGCKIMVRGKGSMRDKKKEELNRGKPNWEHLSEELHVLITVEDTENRAKVKLQRAVEEVKKLLIPADGEDELKKRQLMELAIINGTYRDSNAKALAAAGMFTDEEWRRMALTAAADAQRLMSPSIPGLTPSALRTPTATPLGAPLILSPRLPVPTSAPQGPMLSPADAHSLIYTPYGGYTDYAALAGSPLLTDYTADHSDVMNCTYTLRCCRGGGRSKAAPSFGPNPRASVPKGWSSLVNISQFSVKAWRDRANTNRTPRNKRTPLRALLTSSCTLLVALRLFSVYNQLKPAV